MHRRALGELREPWSSVKPACISLCSRQSHPRVGQVFTSEPWSRGQVCHGGVLGLGSTGLASRRAQLWCFQGQGCLWVLNRTHNKKGFTWALVSWLLFWIPSLENGFSSCFPFPSCPSRTEGYTLFSLETYVHASAFLSLVWGCMDVHMSMCVPMCVCECVCLHTDVSCIHICSCMCMYRFTCVCGGMNRCVYVFEYVSVHMCVCMCASVCLHELVCPSVCVCVHVYICSHM